MAKWRRNKSNTRRWQRNQLITKQSGKCAICDKPFLSMKDVTFDHIIPISKGGDDLLENFQLAHFKCNQSKGDMTQEEFEEFQKGGKLVE
jgi:5-methylcytosine-specific restriction endonuclease McrA